MKYKNKSIAFLLFALGMVSCSTADLESDITGNGSDVLRITTEMKTRGVITGTTFASGDTIGVFALNESGSAFSNTSTNMPVKYNGTSWCFTKNVAHLAEKEKADVYGYYPYTPSVTDITKIPVDIAYHDGDGTGQKDYLYGAGGTHNLSNPEANIQFKFALARITLQLTVASDNTSDELTITKARLTNSSSATTVPIAVSGTMDVKTGTITPITNANATISVPLSAKITKTATTTVEILAIPTTISNGNANLSLVANGNIINVTIPDVTWEKGCQYTYPVNVRLKEGGTQSTTGEAIDLGLPSGVKWASYNIGATKPEEYGDYYAWGEAETKIDYSLNTYKYYYNGSYTNIGSDISGTTYDVAHEKWGGNWRMPTTAEQQELYNNCTCTWTTVNGISGWKFTSKTNNNSIFLPAAGRCHGTSLDDAGTYGYYWSSTLYSSTEGYTCYLGFDSSYINPSYYDGYRDTGLSVRAVSN